MSLGAAVGIDGHAGPGPADRDTDECGIDRVAQEYTQKGHWGVSKIKGLAPPAG